jgi:glucose/arabinose dehydrogenase
MISPNPATTIANISFMVSSISTQQVVITNTTGQEVFKQNILPDSDKVQLPVDVSQLPNGVYTVKVSNNTGISVERLIVQ